MAISDVKSGYQYIHVYLILMWTTVKDSPKEYRRHPETELKALKLLKWLASIKTKGMKRLYLV